MTHEFCFTRGWRLVALTYFVWMPLYAFANGNCFTELSSPQEIAAEARATGHRVRTNDYKVNRTYEEYGSELTSDETPKLETIIEGLPDGSVLFDNGAGLAKAVRHLAKAKEFGRKFRRLIGSTYNEIKTVYESERQELARDIRNLRGRFEYILSGELHEALADPNHAIQPWLGQVDLLIEHYGPTSYADLNVALEWIAQILKPGGQALINLSERNNFMIGDLDIPTEEFFALLPRLTNGRLVVENFGLNEGLEYQVIHIRRVDMAIAESERLELVLARILDDHPPYRTYRIVPRGAF